MESLWHALGMHPSHRFAQYILHLASALGCARFTESTTSLTFRLLAASSAALTGGAAVLPPSPAADERTPLLRDNRRSRVTWPTVSYVCAGCSTGAAFESNLYMLKHQTCTSRDYNPPFASEEVDQVQQRLMAERSILAEYSGCIFCICFDRYPGSFAQLTT